MKGQTRWYRTSTDEGTQIDVEGKDRFRCTEDSKYSLESWGGSRMRAGELEQDTVAAAAFADAVELNTDLQSIIRGIVVAMTHRVADQIALVRIQGYPVASLEAA